MVNSISPLQNVGTAAAKPKYLENLSEIADSADPRSKSYGKYTNAQILQASEKLNARENAAFGHLSHDASSAGIARYAQAYLNYVNQLSPEEQNGVRYQGTRESVTGLLAQAKAQVAQDSAQPTTKASKPTSLLTEMLAEMERIQQKNKAAQGNPLPTERVTISDAARQALQQV